MATSIAALRAPEEEEQQPQQERATTPVSLAMPAPRPPDARQVQPVSIAQPPIPPRSQSTLPGIYEGYEPMGQYEQPEMAAPRPPGAAQPSTQSAEAPTLSDAPSDVPVIHPNGTEGTIPQANLEAALKMGYKQK